MEFKVPLRFSGADLEKDFINCPLPARQMSPDATLGLIIMGPVGVGKTHLSAAIWNKVTEEGRQYFTVGHGERASKDSQIPYGLFPWVDCGELISYLKANTRSGEFPSTMNRMKNARVLFLDDLARERETSFSLDVIGEILYHRYNHKTSTVITTNLDIKEIGQAYDARFASRLVGMTVKVVMAGGDRRLADMKERGFGKEATDGSG